MPHTGDQISYAVSSHNKNYLDSYRVSPAHMTTSMVSGAGMNSMSTPTPLTKSQLNTNQPHLQQLLTVSVKNPPHLQVNDVAIIQSQNTEKTQHQQLEIQNSAMTQMPSNGLKGPQLTQSPATPMSSILRAQLDELKQLPQPLGTQLLSTNEQQICNTFNLPPTSYLSLKTLILSGAPVTSSNLSPVASSIRKYFIKVGWLSH